MNIKRWGVGSIVGALLASIGLVLAVVTAVHAATYDPEHTVTLHVPSDTSRTFVYTSAGVLNLIGDDVHVKLAAHDPDAAIQWAYGTSSDVAAYVGESAALELKGVASIDDGVYVPDVVHHEGSAEAVQADTEVIEAGGFALDSSDLWQKAGNAPGTVELDLAVEPGFDRSLIATTATGEAPALTFTWTSIKPLSSPAPFVVIGVLIALIGVVLLLTDWRDYVRRLSVARQRQEAEDERVASESAQTSVLPVYSGDLAHPSTDRGTQRVHTDSSFGAGILPGTSRTEALRARELSEDDRLSISVSEAQNNEADGHEGTEMLGEAVATADDNHTAERSRQALWEYTAPFEVDEDDENLDDSIAWKGGFNA